MDARMEDCVHPLQTGGGKRGAPAWGQDVQDGEEQQETPEEEPLPDQEAEE